MKKPEEMTNSVLVPFKLRCLWNTEAEIGSRPVDTGDLA